VASDTDDSKRPKNQTQAFAARLHAERLPMPQLNLARYAPMFRSFFLSRRWLPWSLLGTCVILFAYLVSSPAGRADQRVVRNVLRSHQRALGKPGAITMAEYWAQIATFFRIAMIYVTIAVVLDFFVKHYIFRWRTAMNDYYMEHWHKLRHIEGAAQRRAGRHRCALPASWKAWAWTSCAA
jgi:peptide/bleomycin uptake transporter